MIIISIHTQGITRKHFFSGTQRGAEGGENHAQTALGRHAKTSKVKGKTVLTIYTRKSLINLLTISFVADCWAVLPERRPQK